MSPKMHIECIILNGLKIPDKDGNRKYKGNEIISFIKEIISNSNNIKYW